MTGGAHADTWGRRCCVSAISAEHGLGVLRRDEAARRKPAVKLRLVQRVKQAFDPNNLMNPGSLLGPLPTLTHTPTPPPEI